MMKITKITDFTSGKKIQGFFLCLEKHLRTTKSGDLYLDLILQDSTGRINAKLWDMTDKYLDLFFKGDPVAVKGIPSTYQDELQLTISHISVADSARYGKYGFDPLNLVPSINESVEELQKRLGVIIKSVKTTHYRQLLKTIFKKYKSIISILPGSVSYHHPLRGGLLKHMVSCGEIAQALSAHFTDMDGDLVICGVLLHDIGKVNGTKDDLNFISTDEGHFEGHIILGRDIIAEEVGNMEKFPEKDKLKLLHIILSHQGTSSKGSPITPKFPEALLVHYIDEMDGKVEMMERSIKEDLNSGEWTDNRNYFRTELWKG